MATSPTGTPILSPKLVPWIAMFVSVIGGVGFTLGQTVDHPTLAGKIITAAMPILTGLLGILSPGWRTPAPAGQA